MCPRAAREPTESGSERLEKEAHRVSSLLYQGAAGAVDAAAPKPNGGVKDGKKDIVDAEFEEMHPGGP